MNRYRAAVLALISSLEVAAWPQNASTGALTGTVTDPSGALVQSAKVTATKQATGAQRTVDSHGNGTFLIPLLEPGVYTVSVSASGFEVLLVQAVTVNVGETETVPLKLEIGATSETVSVSSSELLVKTESAELGRVTSTQEIENLPLVSRNYTQIIGLNPGVSAEVTNASALGRGAGSQGTGASGFVTQGGVSNDNNFHLNGIEVNDLQGSGDFSGGIPVPNPDSLQEFKVATGQYDASFGRNAGAQVNVITKSGTNQIHGTLFEFLRNNDLNANDWFRTGRVNREVS
ncbi:MAG: carboxypeptidase regulatory-like domain-containing protein [Bryobacteraceae bacterium]